MRVPTFLAAACALAFAGCAAEPAKLTTSALRPPLRHDEKPVRPEPATMTAEQAKHKWCDDRQQKLQRGQVTGETVDQLRQRDDYCRGA